MSKLVITRAVICSTKINSKLQMTCFSALLWSFLRNFPSCLGLERAASPPGPPPTKNQLYQQLLLTIAPPFSIGRTSRCRRRRTTTSTRSNFISQRLLRAQNTPELRRHNRESWILFYPGFPSPYFPWSSFFLLREHVKWLSRPRRLPSRDSNEKSTTHETRRPRD